MKRASSITLEDVVARLSAHVRVNLTSHWAKYPGGTPNLAYKIGCDCKPLFPLLYPEIFGPTQKEWLFPKVDEESAEVSDEAKAEARRIDALKGKTNKYLQMIWWWNKHLNIGNIRVKNAL